MKLLILPVMLMVVVWPAAAGADNRQYDTPAFGGSGGGRFNADCPDGAYVVGVAGRTGDWIDSVRPVCARWSGQTGSFDSPTTGRSVGGGGGAAGTLMCPSGMAVRGWEIARSNDGGTYVRHVRPQCEAVAPDVTPTATIPGQFGGSGVVGSNDRMGYACDKGDLAIGIYGASGAYVDRLGLRCGVGPVFIGRPVPAKPPLSIGTSTTLKPRVVVGAKPPGSVPAPVPPAEISGVIYPNPEIAAESSEMVRLDYCREWGSACGKPAADVYCQSLGYTTSGRTELDNDIGRTVIIATKAICENPICDGFKLIECKN